MARTRISSEVASQRAKLGGLGKNRPHDVASIEAAKAALELAKAAEYVQRLVDEAPSLTPEQRDRLAIVLRPAG